jgi:hypothetical protein
VAGASKRTRIADQNRSAAPAPDGPGVRRSPGGPPGGAAPQDAYDVELGLERGPRSGAGGLSGFLGEHKAGLPRCGRRPRAVSSLARAEYPPGHSTRSRLGANSLLGFAADNAEGPTRCAARRSFAPHTGCPGVPWQEVRRLRTRGLLVVCTEAANTKETHTHSTRPVGCYVYYAVYTMYTLCMRPLARSSQLRRAGGRRDVARARDGRDGRPRVRGPPGAGLPPSAAQRSPSPPRSAAAPLPDGSALLNV